MPSIKVLPAEAPAATLRESLLRVSQPFKMGDLFVPAVPPEALGDRSFIKDYGLKYAYVTGAMANGIASEDLVEAVAKAGMLGFFGAAGLSLPRVEAAIDRLQANLRDIPFGFNLIHSPNEQDLEGALVDLFIHRGIQLVEASAYLGLTEHIVRYRLHGIHRGPDGKVFTRNRVIAKASRVEVVRKFFSPAPERMVAELLAEGKITEEQAELAKEIPIAQDVTAEADSGGHTDNRPLVTMMPSFLALRDELQAQYNFKTPLRVGAAGGISTPTAAAAAFAMGAAYILTGSVNQACVESGSCDAVRLMLSQAEQADTAMAPAADMFEMGVKVQVLKRGTMFAMRASKLYETYKEYPSMEAIPAPVRAQLEKDMFKAPLETIWAQTREFFMKRDPREAAKGDADLKHRMALVFRWYLGLASRWANAGDPARRMDYQVWCGPAMGAFNEWARGTFLAAPTERKAALVGLNILFGAAYLSRLNILRLQGAPLAPELSRFAPRTSDELQESLGPERLLA